MDKQEQKQALREMAKGHDIRAAVAKEALDYGSIPAFFVELSQHGCANGMVGGLIYYRDTHKFFDDHYEEIQKIVNELPDASYIDISGDMKNSLAWFAFEAVAFDVEGELL